MDINIIDILNTLAEIELRTTQQTKQLLIAEKTLRADIEASGGTVIEFAQRRIDNAVRIYCAKISR